MGSSTAQSSAAGSGTTGSSTAGHTTTQVPWVMTRISPQAYGRQVLDTGHDPRGIAPSTQVREVIYHDHSPSNRSGDGATISPESWSGSLHQEFNQQLDSHATAIQELVDRHLDEKLSKFQTLMETYVRHLRS